MYITAGMNDDDFQWYSGVAWPVNSLYISSGIVRICSWKERENKVHDCIPIAHLISDQIKYSYTGKTHANTSILIPPRYIEVALSHPT